MYFEVHVCIILKNERKLQSASTEVLTSTKVPEFRVAAGSLEVRFRSVPGPDSIAPHAVELNNRNQRLSEQGRIYVCKVHSIG